MVNTRVLLDTRPSGWPTESNFRVVEAEVPTPADGEFLVRVHYLSLDPYMRGRMNAGKSYAAAVEVGDVMVGGAVGEIVSSKHEKFRVGTHVVGSFGWQEYATSNGAGVLPVDGARLPLSAYLGPVGMPGVTAYVGLLDIGAPKGGETVIVSAAAGAVGSVVGQIAKLRGCRAVGIVGGPVKRAHVVDDLGFDACIDYKSATWRDDLKVATPGGIDVDFENVGGEILDAILPRMNAFGRVALCGLVSQYNATEAYAVKSFGALLANRIRLEGFIVSERMNRWPEALRDLGTWVAEGKIRYRESVAQGLRAAPAAFLGMLRGENVGKQLVKLV